MGNTNRDHDEIVDKQFQYLGLKLEKLVANKDISVKNKNLTNKDIIISIILLKEFSKIIGKFCIQSKNIRSYR